MMPGRQREAITGANYPATGQHESAHVTLRATSESHILNNAKTTSKHATRLTGLQHLVKWRLLLVTYIPTKERLRTRHKQEKLITQTSRKVLLVFCIGFYTMSAPMALTSILIHFSRHLTQRQSSSRTPQPVGREAPADGEAEVNFVIPLQSPRMMTAFLLPPWSSMSSKSTEGKPLRDWRKTCTTHWRRFRAVTSIKGRLYASTFTTATSLLARCSHQVWVMFRCSSTETRRAFWTQRSQVSESQSRTLPTLAPCTFPLEGKPNVVVAAQVS